MPARHWTPWTRLSLWAGLARLGALEWLAYRVSGALKLLEFPLLILAYSFLFAALYVSLPEGRDTVGGMTLTATLTYIALVWMLDGVLSNSSDEMLGNQMRQGQVAIFIARPLTIFQFLAGKSLGEMGVRLALLGGPLVLIGVLVFGLQPPASVGHGFLFAGSLLLAGMLKYAINFAVGLSALFLENNSGVVVMKVAMVRGLGGLVIPLALLPDPVREALLWTPFPYMYFVPVQAYLGLLPAAELTALLGAQGAWVLIVCLFALGFELYARKVVQIHGG